MWSPRPWSPRLGASSCTWVKAVPGISTDWGFQGLRAAQWRRTLWCWCMKNWLWPGNVRLQPRRTMVAGATSKAVWPWGQRRLFCSSVLLSYNLTWSTASCSRVPDERQRHIKAGYEKGQENYQSSGTSLLPGKTWESWSGSAWRRKLWGDLIVAQHYLKALTRKMGREFLPVPVVIGQGKMFLKRRRVALHWNKLFTMGVVTHWNNLSREVHRIIW